MQALRIASTLEMEHSDWLTHRKNGIGGSDVAAIFGLSRYRSPLQVYMDKLGLIPPIEDNQKMKMGRILEPIIADLFMEDTGIKVRRNNAILQHPEYPWLLANIDRWIVGENAGLEIKNTSEYARSDWSGANAPIEYLMQCNHYMAVTGAERWYICVLIGGWDVQWRVIERDDTVIAAIIEKTRQFWHDHVLAEVPPDANFQDCDLLKQLYPEHVPASTIELTEEQYPLIGAIRAARISLEEAEMNRDDHTNKLKAIMGEHELALFQGDKVASWKTNKKGVRVFKFIGGESE